MPYILCPWPRASVSTSRVIADLCEHGYLTNHCAVNMIDEQVRSVLILRRRLSKFAATQQP
eukprot:1641842-Pleurochrysis_carterae.AAC.1